MAREKENELWEDLKTIVTKKLVEFEAEIGVIVGRDKIERQEHINRAAGMMYGHLIKEVKGIAGNFVGETLKRIDKLS